MFAKYTNDKLWIVHCYLGRLVLDYVYTRGDFSGFVNVFGFINFRVFGFVGVYTERIFGFLTVYTQRQLRKHS